MANVSDSERLVMEALWRRSPRTADEVIEDVAAERGWAPATVKTLLNRLHKKGAVRAEKDGRRYLYSPAISREDYVHGESKGLLDRLFEGRLAPLVSHLTDRDALSREDVRELKRLVEELDDHE
jgi:predicted transcriptional regulator